MTGPGLLLLFALTNSLFVFGQNTMISWKGFYIIQDGGVIKEEDCIFCNPETMPDRVVLDSSKKMIAKRTGNPLGYTYYEWKNKAYTKTYEEVQIRPLKYRSATYYTDSGQVRPPEKNTFNAWHFYFRFPTNTKQRYNGLWIDEKIRVELSKQATDSLLALHKFLKGKLLIGTKFWTELNFYENGKLQSTGMLITGLKESSQAGKEKELMDQSKAPDNQFRVGIWTYYDTNGKLSFQETIPTIKG